MTQLKEVNSYKVRRYIRHASLAAAGEIIVLLCLRY